MILTWSLFVSTSKRHLQSQLFIACAKQLCILLRIAELPKPCVSNLHSICFAKQAGVQKILPTESFQNAQILGLALSLAKCTFISKPFFMWAESCKCKIFLNTRKIILTFFKGVFSIQRKKKAFEKKQRSQLIYR